ncbi:hypothetical protein VPNG_02296 [Cytospora leucostoma]|uniref:protein O-GlcNAc transferase n=1 Tax=Cytospora leucostoma TaxID=1230097 RepID=A0A423XH67_9PEZI|nr:hypothetical protein VPNG_02296 [Cytospora leucostoma]
MFEGVNVEMLRRLGVPHKRWASQPSRPSPRPFDPYPTSNRPSQWNSAYHRIFTNFPQSQISDNTEHHLRRKTPNGTIDNGYDGTPTQLAAGPPPQKYLNMTPSGDIFPTAHAGHQIPATGNTWWYPSQSLRSGHDEPSPNPRSTPVGGSFGQGNLAYTPAHGPLLASPSAHMHTMQMGPAMRNGYGNTYQNHTAPSPSNFSPGGITPSAVWGDGPFAGFHQNIQMSSTGYPPHNVPYESGFVAVQAPQPQAGLGMYPYAPSNFALEMATPPYLLDDGLSRHVQLPSMPQSTHRGLQNLSLGQDPPGTNGVSSHLQFKEGVLAAGHKAYSDLVNHVCRVKKVQHGRTHSKSSKNIIFPRAPKQLMLRPTSRLQRSHQTFPGAMESFSHRMLQQPMNAASAMNRVHWSSDLLPSVRLDVNGRSLSSHPALMGGAYGGTMVHNTPVDNAKASLEILHNLCEQTGWKWVDGMLLGGCLQYGLERYEEALEWFKRIIDIDANHVEAISNIAAALYCLNRQDDAEKHWLRAIKIRPDYLEALEHLVGLLCSTNRSKQAVDTIEHVQKQLRIPSHDLHNQKRLKKGIGTDSNSTPTDLSNPDDPLIDAAHAVRNLSVSNEWQDDWGSSGYRVPASENWRMLGLVHAKGNMLYTLKLIDRASEAFEEAVLISAGRNIGDIQNLIRRIQLVLSPRAIGPQPLDRKMLSAPLLLPPDKAKLTAEIVFASTNGQLPGLRYVVEGSHKKTAISTTSNSLLSLAKIFQDAMSAGGSAPGLRAQPCGGVGDILALYYLSLSLQESPSTANNVGILLASVQQTSQSAPMPGMSYAPRIPGIVPGSGLELALAYYQYGLHLDPKHVHLHTNLGSLLKDIGQLDYAIQMYQKAVECDSTFDIALTNLANAVKDRGRIEEAIKYYRRAVDSNPEFAEAVCGLSTALNSVCDWKGRGGVFLNGGKFDRWHVDDNGMIFDVQESGQGSGLMKKVVDIVARQLKDASAWGSGILTGGMLSSLVSQLNSSGAFVTDPSLNLDAELRNWAGKPWEGSRLVRLVERSIRAAMRNWYLDKYERGIEAVHGYPRPRLPSSLTVPSAPTVLPFHTFTCPLTARDVRRISQRNALRISCSTLRSPWLPNSVYPPPRPPSPCLNIGYVSSDFNNHPLAHLMQSVFGFHDQARAKAFCYATTASDGSEHRKQIERESPVFRDVSTWSSDKLIEQIVRDGIHILVNLNGYTRGARNEVFAARPAPIQMSFMGFAGTLGAEWCDYLLADSTAIPPETLRPHRGNLSLADVFQDDAEGQAEDWVYSENIIFCRSTFFCCDHRQSADSAERMVNWEEEQRRRWEMRKEIFPDLPDDTIILGNFNQLYKIDPTTFRTWLRILANTPKAILWLLKFPELGERALKKTAEDWAGAEVASRIRFTDVAPKQLHISRARVCDLFLDTPECNAHTTAADVLWSSTPLLTLPRYKYKMCSRMAASILKGALPQGPAGEEAARQLIAEDDDDYEKKAIKLANGVSYCMTEGGFGQADGRLWELRKLLFESKWSCALFDTRRWVSDLEDAYEEAWGRWVKGIDGDIYL